MKSAQNILKNLNCNMQETLVLKDGFEHSYLKEKKVYVLSTQELKNMSHPVYFAFLSALELNRKGTSEKDLIQLLEIEPSDYRVVKKSLLEAGFIKEVNGSIARNIDRVETGFEISSQDIRASHKMALNRIIQNIDSVEVSRRDVTRYTVATTPKKMLKAKKMIQKFSRKLAEFLESGEKTDVYELSIQLFPWSVK